MSTIPTDHVPDRGPDGVPDHAPDGVSDLGPDRAQLGVAALLAVVGAYTVYDASTLEVGFADPVGPQLFPYVVGIAGLVLAGLLVLATVRGSRGEVEGGEDVDLTQSSDWVTVTKLIAVIVLTIAVIDVLGWAITGGILFAGAAWALGSRTLLRDAIVGVVLAVASWYGFYVGLGIPLTPGILDGIL